MATRTFTGTDWRSVHVPANGIRLHATVAGDGPPVVLLHGFPQSWHAWRHQIPALATRATVVAADLRGYGESDRPDSGYDLDTLSDDIADLIVAFGPRAAVIGHDWGGVIAWWLAMRRPERVERLGIVNAPHPAAMLRELRQPRQILRSSYVFAFQLPALPELVLRAADGAALRWLVRKGAARPEALDDHLRAMVNALRSPGALRAALAYYRELRRLRPATVRRVLRRIDAPTTVVWGERDPALSVHLLDGLEAWVADLHRVRLPDAGHFVPEERPEAVSAHLLELLARPAEGR